MNNSQSLIKVSAEDSIYSLTYFSKMHQREAEKDWLEGNFAVGFREATSDDHLGELPEHQIKRKRDKILVPKRFDGLRPGDAIGVIINNHKHKFIKQLVKKAYSLKKCCVLGIEAEKIRNLSKTDKYVDTETCEIISKLMETDFRYFNLLELQPSTSL